MAGDPQRMADNDPSPPEGDVVQLTPSLTLRLKGREQ